MLEFEFEFGEGPPLPDVLEATDSEGDVGPSLLGNEPWTLFGIKMLIGGLKAAEIWLEACDWMISSGFKKKNKPKKKCSVSQLHTNGGLHRKYRATDAADVHNP